MKIAVVRIRGRRKVSPKIKKTLELLNLSRTNNCVVIEDTPQHMGMINVCMGYVTFGAINEGTLFSLLRKRGEKGSRLLREIMEDEEIHSAAKKIMHEEKVRNFVDPVFRLHPPRKGYKAVKMAAPRGDLGRRETMDALIKRMM